jgi:eukaryotic-like serine/threonine-protein kinase
MSMANTGRSGVLPPGYILMDRYEIQREVGRGSMGIVYQALRIADQTMVAIKIVDQQLRTNAEALERFRREAEAGNRIQHPNVVQVLDYDQTPWGTPFIVEEFLNGKDLQVRLEAGETFSLRDITFLMVAICDALEAAHAQGIVHRDLKPGNVVTGRGNYGELSVKLIDFGLAKMISSAGASPGLLTAEFGSIGTPAYMAPEQIRNEPLDGRADIYSMGTMMYQLLCGELPFWSDNPLDFTDKVLTEKPIDVRKRAPNRGIPATLGRLTMQAIAREPKNRPRDVREMREKLIVARKELTHGHARPGFFRRILEALRLA